MGVAIGSPVSAANTNQAFLDANGDDTTIGRVTLANTLTESGTQVDNTQRELNAEASYTGMPLNSAKDVVPAWVNNDVGTNSDTLKERGDALTAKFNNTTGHKHTGAAGDAPQVSSVDLANVQLSGYMIQGSTLVGVTGSTLDVSTQFAGFLASSGSSSKGVVVTPGLNQNILHNTDGTNIEDGSGNEVYGRLTNSGLVWTLDFYSLVAGVETVYSFATATDIVQYFQQLFNPVVDAPVYTTLLTIPSTSTTADIIQATETLAGKAAFANADMNPVSTTNDRGSSIRMAKADHTHKGISGFKKTGGSYVYGDIEIDANSPLSIIQSGNKFTLDGGGAVGFQEVPSGPCNGVNTTFGPLSQLPSSTESVVVFVDGRPVDKSDWTLSGYSIIFSASIPLTGQDVYVFYLSAGIPAIPPTPSGTLHTEFRTLTSGEAAAKIVVLANTPSSPGLVLVDIISGCAQEFNVDYTIVTNEFRWSGYALDGVLTTGDRIRFHYLT